jgi:hypothetical protein
MRCHKLASTHSNDRVVSYLVRQQRFDHGCQQVWHYSFLFRPLRVSVHFASIRDAVRTARNVNRRHPLSRHISDCAGYFPRRLAGDFL